MSNPIHLIATTFDSHAMGGECTSFGFRIFDNNNQYYVDNGDFPIMDNIELLQYALKCEGNDIKSFFDFMRETGQGININGQWYDYDTIKQYFKS